MQEEGAHRAALCFEWLLQQGQHFPFDLALTGPVCCDSSCLGTLALGSGNSTTSVCLSAVFNLCLASLSLVWLPALLSPL